jgi:hypothetical protein
LLLCIRLVLVSGLAGCSAPAGPLGPYVTYPPQQPVTGDNNTRNGLLAILAGDFYDAPRLLSPLRRLQLAYGCLYLCSKLGARLQNGGLTWQARR